MVGAKDSCDQEPTLNRAIDDSIEASSLLLDPGREILYLVKSALIAPKLRRNEDYTYPSPDLRSGFRHAQTLRIHAAILTSWDITLRIHACSSKSLGIGRWFGSRVSLVRIGNVDEIELC